jgi:hypothetical protein
MITESHFDRHNDPMGRDYRYSTSLDVRDLKYILATITGMRLHMVPVDLQLQQVLFP